MQATVEASISNTIEELQKLNRAFSTKTGDITKRRRRYRTRVLLRFGTCNRGQFADHLMVIKEVTHDLKKLTLPREFAQQLPYAIFGHAMCVWQTCSRRVMSINSSPLRIANSAALFSIVDISTVNPPLALKIN